jgi:hypothetical protein
MQEPEVMAADVRVASTPTARYRWRICALLLAATTINYIDRQVLGVLAPDLQRELRSIDSARRSAMQPQSPCGVSLL